MLTRRVDTKRWISKFRIKKGWLRAMDFASAIGKTVGLYKHKCKQCMKEFECRREYAYKIPFSKNDGRYYWFCSYKCIRAYERDHDKRKKPTEAQKRILDLLDSGMKLADAARMLGMRYSQVAFIRDKFR